MEGNCARQAKGSRTAAGQCSTLCLAAYALTSMAQQVEMDKAEWPSHNRWQYVSSAVKRNPAAERCVTEPGYGCN